MSFSELFLQNLRSIDAVSQYCVCALGLVTIWFVSEKSKWACVVGLINQPFWFLTTIINQQWPLVAITTAYTLLWAKGLSKWFREEKKERRCVCGKCICQR